ncbi:hypothetical protein PRZ48_007884 [Zasmidium cellare]|uniref:Transmembrane protein n=1 Tax=Zasmidium cellare TaxID=395010 RepID=A0ABR0EMN4_ZASCE|nr:hypothetical protein PRZ48_007884 [Zasmidium cellare]
MDATHLAGRKRVLCMALNVFVVMVIFRCTVILFQNTFFPLTIFRATEICIAIYYRFIVLPHEAQPNCYRKQIDHSQAAFHLIDESQHKEPGHEQVTSRDTVGVVVGWREKKVFPDAPLVHFSLPIGEPIELGHSSGVDIEALLNQLEATLEHRLGKATLMSCSALCVYKPHRCKKSILFAAFLVALVMGRLGRGEFIWSGRFQRKPFTPFPNRPFICGLATMCDSSWCSSDTSESLGKRIYEVGAVIVWLSVVFAALGRAVAQVVVSCGVGTATTEVIIVIAVISCTAVSTYALFQDLIVRARKT